MTEKKRTPRDIWKQPPAGSEGDATKEFEGPPAPVEDERAPVSEGEERNEQRTEEKAEAEAEEAGYLPRHRAPGRAPLIRRKRNRIGDEEEVSWETSWSNEPASRWTTEEEPSVTPPPKPLEELPYLGPRRSEQRRRRPRPTDEAAGESARRSRDYTGRHLAPKKPARWARGEDEGADSAVSDDDYVEFQDRDRVEEVVGKAALVEGDAAEPETERLEAEPAEAEPAEAEPAEAEPAEAEQVAPTETGSTTREPAEDERPAAGPGRPAPETAAVEAIAPTPEAAPAPSPADPEPAEEVTAEEVDAEERPAAASAATPSPEAVVPSTPPAAPPSPAPPAPASVEEVAVFDPDDDVAATEADVHGDEEDEDVDEDVEAVDEGADEDDEDEDGEDEETLGPRKAALLERKKKKRVRKTLGTVAAVLAATVAVAATGVLVKNAVDPEEKVAVPISEPPPDPKLGGTTLLFGTKESSDSGRGAIWMSLITYDPETEEASVVYVPPHTAVEVPGRGLQGVGEAYGSGGIPLLLVSAENLLGIQIDRYVELSDKDALVLFEQLEPLTVDVPAEVRVPVGKNNDEARLIFVEGPQELTPPLLVKLLYIVGIEGDDVELGGRHLAFWQQLLEAHEPDELADAIEAAGAALGESDAPVEELAEVLSAVAAVPTEDLTLSALPVRPISAGESELYATDTEELAAFVQDTIGVDPDAPEEVRIQLLNGNGEPGLGREVADLLVGEGFRVILGGNAQRLNYRRTLVIAYDSSDEAIATAERARDLLGVGEVQVSAQQQGIVDLTIVVGKDFLRAQ